MKIEDMKTGYVIEKENIRGLVIKVTSFTYNTIVLYEDGEWDFIEDIMEDITNVYAPTNAHYINPINIATINLDAFLIWQKQKPIKCGDYVTTANDSFDEVVYVVSAVERMNETLYNLINMVNGYRYYPDSISIDKLQEMTEGIFKVVTIEEAIKYISKLSE